MRKTYWWRILVLAFAAVMFGYGYIAVNINELGFYNSFIDPLMFLSLSLLAVSPFLFFIRDDVFKKWLRFSAIWFVIATVLIALSPERSGSWGPSYNPTKESVSIWMASLFVIGSLMKITWDSRKKASL